MMRKAGTEVVWLSQENSENTDRKTMLNKH